jgi:DNA-binding transcriptional MerR regulator
VPVDQRHLPSLQRTSDRLLSIGVFARRSRLSTKALRLYDRLGVLTPAHVDQVSGYRRYRESQLATARLVAMLRRLDMPLSQVAEVVSAVDIQGAEVAMLRRPEMSPPQESETVSNAGGARGAELVATYWETVERRIASQRELAAHLRNRLQGREGSFDMYEIRERDVPEQIVLTEQRHVQADELPRWIGAAMTRLMKSAGTLGGPAGYPFVVYHGEVNQDSDGPVEVCVPVKVGQEASTEAAVRQEPAHHEAYVRLRKAQVAFPQILSAYDAVSQWISAKRLSVAGSPREVYFTDFGSAAPTDEVCDVAFPVRAA